jgi:tRNA (guanine-N7-)-methyltransferase
MKRTFKPEAIPPIPDPTKRFIWEKTKGLRRVLEIGAGTGENALRHCLEHPQDFVIAIERTTTKFQRFQSRLSELPQPPIHLEALQADALWWCAQNLTQSFLLDQILILYPNPYPKKKQANLRFVNMPFMGYLLEHLTPGGTLEISTNKVFYYEEAKVGFLNDWGLNIVTDRQLNATDSPRTAFERKYLSRGETCYQLIFRK